MNCYLCPRKCGIDRKTDTGYCKMGDDLKIAKIMLHHWEEPPISGENGSGAIFFSGCSLKCVYCQNEEISHGGLGKPYTVDGLAKEMLRLQEMGAHNINLVTPTHYGDKIRKALDLIKGQLKIPVVYNTSGYELDTEIEKMAGYVDVFLTDAKYFSPEASQKYSGAKDYYEVFKKALVAMLKIAPAPTLDRDGIMQSGVIIRHLVLPTLRRDSIKLLTDIKESFDISKIKLSLMAQYTPDFCRDSYPELKRKLTTFEYSSVLDHAISLGYDGYMQDKSSIGVKYTPDFSED